MDLRQRLLTNIKEDKQALIVTINKKELLNNIRACDSQRVNITIYSDLKTLIVENNSTEHTQTIFDHKGTIAQ